MMLLPAFTATRHTDIAPFVNHIFHADALDLLAALPDASVDMVLADLPYGVTACAWDSIIPIEPMWEGLKRVVKRRAAIVLTATQPFTSRLVSSNYAWYRSHWIWDKARGVGFQISGIRQLMQHEDIIVFGYPSVHYYPQLVKRNKPITSKVGTPSSLLRNNPKPILSVLEHEFPKSILTYNKDADTRYHATQKPVALFEYLIRTYTQPGEIVLDMTCGSGTTAVAALKSDRRYICGDNGTDDRTGRAWADIARQRVQNSDPYAATILPDGSKQLSLFTEAAYVG